MFALMYPITSGTEYWGVMIIGLLLQLHAFAVVRTMRDFGVRTVQMPSTVGSTGESRLPEPAFGLACLGSRTQGRRWRRILSVRLLELPGRAMCTTSDVLLGEHGEPALDLVQPRCRGGHEVNMESRMWSEPSLDGRCL